MKRFNENLKTLRETHGLTQEALGEKIGLAKSTISMYERGHREPSFEIIEAIADYFNVNLSLLMGDAEGCDGFALTPDEAKLLGDYRALSDVGKQYIRQTMRLAAQSYGGEQEPERYKQ